MKVTTLGIDLAKSIFCLQRFNSEPGDALKLSHPRLD